jgi:hypothetical protein
MFNQRLASQVAQTILAQLGGAGKLRMLAGAKTVILVPNGVEIHIPRSPKGVFIIRIVLTGKDLYDLTFFGAMNSKTLTRKIKSTQNDVYNEELISTVEQHTGLFLSLRGRTASALAEEIIELLGGRDNIKSFTNGGSVQVLSGNKGIIFPRQLPYGKGDKIYYIHVLANNNGSYDVNFLGAPKGKTPNVKKSLKDVPAENLLFEIMENAYRGRTANAMSDIQEDIIAILGGRQNMASLIGDARVLPSSGDKGIIFAIPYVRGQGVTHIKIVANDMGNYDVTFFAPMTGTTPKVKKALKDVSEDSLLSVIKRYAYLSF